MTNGAFLPATSADPLFLGSYPSTTPYPNPISEAAFTGFTQNNLKFYEEKDPSLHASGDIDSLIYYPFRDGAFRDTATAIVPFSVLLDNYKAHQAMIDEYLRQVEAYNSRALEYNAAYLGNQNGKTTKTETTTYNNGNTKYSTTVTYTGNN